jgi:hypothetical protein
MRFIRVHGRVVPVKERGAAKQQSGGHPIVLGAAGPAGIAGFAILGTQTGHITKPSKILGEKAAKFGTRANRMLAKSGPMFDMSVDFQKAATQMRNGPASDAAIKASRLSFKGAHLNFRSAQAKQAGMTLGKISARAGKIAGILRKVRL